MNAFIEQLTTSTYVSAEDVLRMRRRVFGDQVIDHDEMADLIQLGQRAPEGDRSWRQFLGEAMADFFIRQAEPRGYMSEENAAFLLDCLDEPADISVAVLDALSHMVRNAQMVPAPVISFGLEAIRAHVLADGVIDEAETERVRAFLFAAGGAGNVAITREEADFLFDLNDAAHEAGNAPAWADLFMKAIANHLMAHIGYQPPSRREALRRDAWLRDTSVDFQGFLQRMAAGGFSGVLDSYRQSDGWAEHNNRRKAQAAVAAILTPGEVDWLVARIERDGVFNHAERALITHLRALNEATTLPSRLQNMLARI